MMEKAFVKLKGFLIYSGVKVTTGRVIKYFSSELGLWQAQTIFNTNKIKLLYQHRHVIHR